jgi:hypothetical protein
MLIHRIGACCISVKVNACEPEVAQIQHSMIPRVACPISYKSCRLVQRFVAAVGGYSMKESCCARILF